MKISKKIRIIFLLLIIGASLFSVQKIEAAQELVITDERLVVFEIFTRET